MKPILKFTGIILAALLLIILVFTLYVNFKSFPTYESVEIRDIKVNKSPEVIALGKKLVDHDCAGCHRGSAKQYEGMLFEDITANETFGDIYTPNITQHPDHGIGKYSEGELYRLLRTGVKKDGTVLLPVMPRYLTMSDEDLNAIIAYLKSNDEAIQPSAKEHPVYQPSLLAKVLLNFVIQPEAYKTNYPQKPSILDSLLYGAYAVNDLYGCFFCHSKSLEEWNMENPKLTPGYLGGGTKFTMVDYEVVAPSLLMDGKSNVSNWTSDEFIGAVLYGQIPGKNGYLKPMHPYPLMDTTEVRAIYHYLKDYSSL